MLHFGRLVLLAGFLTLSGCTPSPSQWAWDTGSLAVRAPFGQRSVQIIPEGTQRIEVRVSGAGIPAGAVLAAALTPQRPEALFGAMPAGPKHIDVKALDADEMLVAQGQADATIVAGATITARIQLELTTDQGQFDLAIE